ncbi:hypothetical protein D7V94_02730 [Parablautia intestinalis]|uniref:Uncharacterized protein n=1 Tax=Parablautia intestinalis TaxID=2320100 RepID=A0A3A9AQE9_9FIRM|nr:hypothetical protein [Parablautia intestinalis]MCI8614234.1 hypothetical protein [Lachnospiraceae bacterium]RKI93622.1 hypothetical protein D7V94_02730 [Parablautia intestinalis]
MENENIYRQEKIEEYRLKMGKIFRYIPWLEEKAGTKLVHNYDGEKRLTHSIQIPVYDSTLLAFVKEMQGTGLMSRNYVYVYSRYGIKSVKDELKLIEQAEFGDMENILGIMAKYVLGGMTKGILWSTAVENGVFLSGLKQMKKLLDFWDRS